MFKHILVPIDLGDRQGRMLRTARDLSVQSGARVTLLHVVQQVADTPQDELRGFYRRLVKSSQRRLAEVARPFAERGVRVRAEVCIGDPAGEIVRRATARRIDLLVMGSHKVTPGQRSRGWGTTSYKVGLLCRCPVLLVK